MKCDMQGCTRRAKTQLQQKQLGRRFPCRVLCYCDKHTPTWAKLEQGADIGETPFYYFERIKYYRTGAA